MLKGLNLGYVLHWFNVAYQSIGNRLSKTRHDVQGAGSLEEAWGCVVRSFLRLSPRFLASDRDPPETPGLLKSELEAVLTLLVCAFAAYVTAGYCLIRHSALS